MTFHLRNDLYYVEWGIKLYSLTHLNDHGKNNTNYEEDWYDPMCRLNGGMNTDQG